MSPCPSSKARPAAASSRAVRVVAQRVGERRVDAATTLRAGALQHRRAHQRVTEPHRLHVELDDGGVGGRLEVIGIELRGRGEAAGPQQLADALFVVDRGDEEQPPGRLGEVRDARGERLLEAIGERERATGRRGGMTGLRELDERERVARGLAQQPAAHGGRELRARRLEQRGRGRRVERPERLLGQPGLGERRVVPVAGGDEQHDPVRLDAARDEREHVGGGVVEAVGVVDGDEQGRLRGDVGEQVQGRHGDAELLRCGVVGEAEGGVERGTVGWGQARGVVADRAHELVHAREGQMGLGLHAVGPQDGDAPPPGQACRLGEQA